MEDGGRIRRARPRGKKLLTAGTFPGQLDLAREFTFRGTPPPLRPSRAPAIHGFGVSEQRVPMKLIIALIQPTKLEAVKEALSHVEVFRLTVMDVQGFGRQKGYTEVYRGHEFTVNLLRKIELQIAVNED